ncbi:hypothetical protein K1719_004944 [Acacia pycnantha]|nr:hypothetical protein K1719_004944 [Acacia pycnantha]
MAATALHIRSNSFPSASHPILSQFEEHLNRLKSSETASTSICQKLGSLMLLDVCIIAKDCLQQSKESVQELQSVIRRRGTEAGCRIEGVKYLASRKMIKKTCISSSLGSKEWIKAAIDDAALTSKELCSIVEQVDVGEVKQSRWSNIRKMMQPRRIACDSEE